MKLPNPLKWFKSLFSNREKLDRDVKDVIEIVEIIKKAIESKGGIWLADLISKKHGERIRVNILKWLTAILKAQGLTNGDTPHYAIGQSIYRLKSFPKSDRGAKYQAIADGLLLSLHPEIDPVAVREKVESVYQQEFKKKTI